MRRPKGPHRLKLRLLKQLSPSRKNEWGSVNTWIGIDEAGYGPNLGPLVMAAVIAQSPDDREPDLWGDLGSTISRARGPSECLWVDDSKQILKGGKGRDRLDQAAFATLQAAGIELPATYSSWLNRVGAGSLAEVELTPWLTSHDDPSLFMKRELGNPLANDHWRIVAVRAVVVGPTQFNADIDATGSKATAHFRAFARLLQPIWATLDTPGHVICDKHGGRNFYLNPLADAFPNIWIDRGVEGPALSVYTLREDSKKLTMKFRPRADAESGLVALASITAKALRESWMDTFNGFWGSQIPNLKPTAGYPMDAARFRTQIEPIAERLDLQINTWWRSR
jgi:hypothetical protein